MQAGYVVLDILFFIVPVVVDAATGAWWDVEPEKLDVILPEATEETKQ